MIRNDSVHFVHLFESGLDAFASSLLNPGMAPEIHSLCVTVPSCASLCQTPWRGEGVWHKASVFHLCPSVAKIRFESQPV